MIGADRPGAARAALFLALLLPWPAAATAQALPSIAEKTKGAEPMSGLLPLYWDSSEGKLWLEVPSLDDELLYVEAMTAGLGSNDVGLDRSQLGGEKLVYFHRVGPKVLLVQPNLGFRAGSGNEAERRAVEESFAKSVIWGFTVAAETEGRVLVDATDFVLRDSHDVVATLKRSGQGTFRLEPSRSAVYLPRTKAFPRNTEIEATLTFTGDEPGRYVREVTPTPEAVTVRVRHSFVALPEPGFEMRRAHPAAGFFGIEYADYASPLGQPMEQRFIARHRLEKKDPSAARSEPVEPIVYHLDPGVPEPVRGALLDGARWWNQAFEAAGYIDAFRVELLPEGADPMDVRYNVIQWVHRATRGWSYGGSVTDPRTGEILKGHVLLGSLRVRQDYRLAEGLLSPYAEGEEVPPELAAMALARIRQLSAHEVGHTLGLAHNYIASAQGPQGRASVMDYPHPLVRLAADGSIDLSDAYDAGIGEWDEVAIAYGYQDFPEGTDEREALDAIIAKARAEGITFLSDEDARPAGSVHPLAHLWDTGRGAAAELERMMEVRRAALDRFGETAVPAGTPLALLEETLVPLYLHHRYQVEAAVKVLGGQYYTYALRGDAQEPLRPVSAAEQIQALDALLVTLDPAELAVPDEVLGILPPRPYGYQPHRELFPRYTGLAFDAIAPAAVAADITLALVLQPERAARLVQQNARDPRLPGLDDVLERLVDATFERRHRGYLAEIDRAVENVFVARLVRLAAGAPMPQVRAVALLQLTELLARVEGVGGDDAERAHNLMLAREIGRFLDNPGEYQLPELTLPAPPGSPIGDGG